MRLFIDRGAVSLFAYRTSSSEYGDTRRYYCAASPYRAIIVCRNGLELHGLAGQVVDAQVGTDAGWRDFVREGNESQSHSKITIYRTVPGRAHATLSGVLREAPKEE